MIRKHSSMTMSTHTVIFMLAVNNTNKLPPIPKVSNRITPQYFYQAAYLVEEQHLPWNIFSYQSRAPYDTDIAAKVPLGMRLPCTCSAEYLCSVLCLAASAIRVWPDWKHPGLSLTYLTRKTTCIVRQGPQSSPLTTRQRLQRAQQVILPLLS